MDEKYQEYLDLAYGFVVENGLKVIAAIIVLIVERNLKVAKVLSLQYL
ncbi:hypothetical protein OU798_19105 [Prolixibacteraceae bacterium Z1-6]|uniref:Uncharacterized protein n=1 Tax=Draconibacterium aestuarii TaxID=2998507 RepID=A0A9X3F8D4_9BACT|nr:hypothetical protein [Prolixibacteraceae bacterium Z1-6]